MEPDPIPYPRQTPGGNPVVIVKTDATFLAHARRPIDHDHTLFDGQHYPKSVPKILSHFLTIR